MKKIRKTREDSRTITKLQNYRKKDDQKLVKRIKT